MPPSPFSYLETAQEQRIRATEDPVRRANAINLYSAVHQLDALIISSWLIPLVLSGITLTRRLLFEPSLDRISINDVALATVVFVAVRIGCKSFYFSNAQRAKTAEIREVLATKPDLQTDLELVFQLAPGIGSRCRKLLTDQ
jgi:hypothetical protein